MTIGRTQNIYGNVTGRLYHICEDTGTVYVPICNVSRGYRAMHVLLNDTYADITRVTCFKCKQIWAYRQATIIRDQQLDLKKYFIQAKNIVSGTTTFESPDKKPTTKHIKRKPDIISIDDDEDNEDDDDYYDNDDECDDPLCEACHPSF